MKSLFTWSDIRRDRSLMMPTDITRFTNIPYGTKMRQHKLDVYLPTIETREQYQNSNGKLPVIVSVHGGGWVHGSKEGYQHYCMEIARYGFAVINFSYRLAPLHKFPSFLEDTVQAFDWVYEYADEYGLDTEHIYAVGDSAGANILSLYCELGTNPQFAQKFAFTANQKHIPRAVALNCGVYKADVVADTKRMQDMQDNLYDDVLGTHGKFAQRTLLNAVDYVTEKFPPAFVTTASGDFLKEQAPLMVNALKNAGVDVQFKSYGTEENQEQYGHVFHLNTQEDNAAQCNKDQIEFFREH